MMETMTKTPTPITEKMEHDWNEVRLCAEMIRRGLGHIRTRRLADGSTVRYTKITGKRGTGNGAG